MPIFEYTCEDCGTAFEKLMRASAPDDVACPSCGQDHVKKEWSTFAARAHTAPTAAQVPVCPSGMCQNPSGCGSH